MTVSGREQAVRERAEATWLPEGPWLRIGDEVSTPAVDIVRWAYSGMPPAEWEDAETRYLPILEFIAHAREDVPWLLARVDELTAALERIVEMAEGRRSRVAIAAVAREALAPVSVPEAAKEEAT